MTRHTGPDVPPVGDEVPAGRPPMRALSSTRLVVGYDGSPASADAVALAVPLARLWACGVHVVTVHTPVVLGGHAAAADREAEAARCAEEGARLLGGTVCPTWGERRGPNVAAELHQCAVATAGLVVGRPHPRVLGHPRSRVVEDSPVPVALARRHLRPHPVLRSVVLALTGDEPEADESRSAQLDVLTRFAEGLRHQSTTGVTVCVLGRGDEDASILTETAFELGRAVGHRVHRAVVTPEEAGRRWSGDELLVCVGRPFGAHGHLGSDPAERALIAADGPSILVLPPPAVATGGP